MKAVVIILILLSVNITFSQSPDTLYPVKVYTQDGYKYGYINRDGYLIIKPQFAFAKDFSEGLAFVKNEINSNKWLCINTSSAVQFEITAEYVFEYKNNIARIIRNDSSFYINKYASYGIYLPYPFPKIQRDKQIPFLFYEGNKVGYILENDSIVIPPIFERAGEFADRIAPVFLKFKESDLPDSNCYNAFIDIFGNILIKAELKYDDHGYLESGYFYSPEKWVNGVCRYYTSNDPATMEVKYIRSDGKIIW